MMNVSSATARRIVRRHITVRFLSVENVQTRRPRLPGAPNASSVVSVNLTRLLVNHPAQLGAEALYLREFLLDAVKEGGLRLDSFINEEGGGLGAVAEDACLDKLFESLLRVVRDFDGDHVVVLGRDGALDGAADVAPDGA